MFNFDSLLLDNGFAVGSLKYSDHYSEQSSQNHIVIPLTFVQDNSLHIRAILDTAAKWCIIDPNIAKEWEKLFFNRYDSNESVNIRGTPLKGSIAHAQIILRATNGDDLILDARFFIPQLAPNQDWLLPNFIGLDGMLNCMRFAIDPAENAIYFGKG